jgi:SEC-C motif-containing protein
VRARYTAYALGAGKYREFLIRTWHPATAGSVSIQDLTNDIFNWKGLQIIQASQQGDYGKVEFKAKFSENGGADNLHHERSIFQRINGVWLYVEGEVRTG